MDGAGGDLPARPVLSMYGDPAPAHRGSRAKRHHLSHGGRVGIQVARGRVAVCSCFVPQLVVDGVCDASATRRPRKHISHSSQDGLGGQVGTELVNDGEHQCGRTLGTNITRDLQRVYAAR